MEHLIEPALLTRRVVVHLVGVGGNGAQMAGCLARLDLAMRALGHPYGLYVAAFDDDTVSPSNVGRQVFSRADIGHNKAVLQVSRLNAFYGLDWDGTPQRYRGPQAYTTRPDIVVSCVDSRASRRELHRELVARPCVVAYWLDLGNRQSTAQVVLGEPRRAPGARRAGGPRLPCVTELYAELLDDTVPEDDTPSCSVRVSLAAQGLFVNDLVVRWGAQLLYELFSKGRVEQHGVILNLDGKRSAPIHVDHAVWARFGYRVEAPVAGGRAEERKEAKRRRRAVEAVAA